MFREMTWLLIRWGRNYPGDQGLAATTHAFELRTADQEISKILRFIGGKVKTLCMAASGVCE